MKHVKNFNSISPGRKTVPTKSGPKTSDPIVYESPEGLIEDIKETFYILSDYGCQINYSMEDYTLSVDIDVSPITSSRTFSDFKELIRLRNKLESENELIYVNKLIEFFTRLDHLVDNVGGFDYKVFGMNETDRRAKSLDILDDISIDINFHHDNNAIINDINGVISVDDEIVSNQVKVVAPDSEYSGWEIGDNLFLYDFYMSKCSKLTVLKILNHFNRIMGEYFKFEFSKEFDGDDYQCQLKGELKRGRMLD